MPERALRRLFAGRGRGPRGQGGGSGAPKVVGQLIFEVPADVAVAASGMRYLMEENPGECGQRGAARETPEFDQLIKELLGELR